MVKRKYLISFFFLFFSNLCFARVYIDIEAPGQEKIPIAISYFVGERKIALEARTILQKDLEYTGFFEILKPETFLEEKPTLEVDFKKWQLIGAYLLIKGQIKILEKDLEIKLYLYDVYKGIKLLGKRYEGKINFLRYMIHRFSDAIIEILTGKPSIFQTKIAFVYEEKNTKEIYITDFDGYNFYPLTRFKNICLSPRWHPKGNKLLFTSYKKGRPEVYLLDLKKPEVIRLIHYPGLNISPAWSPDGEYIAVTLTKAGYQGIYLTDNKGKVIKCLVRSKGINVSPTFSPDGKKIAFVSDRSGSPQIYILDIVSGKIRRLTFEGNYNTSPAWSPKGNYIAYSGMRDGHFHIFVIKSDGSEIKQLTYDEANHESPSWSPDGHFIAFSQNGKIYILRMADGCKFPVLPKLPGRQTQPNWSPYLR